MHVRDRIARPNSPYCRLRIMFNSPANRMDLAAHSGSQFLPHPRPSPILSTLPCFRNILRIASVCSPNALRRAASAASKPFALITLSAMSSVVISVPSAVLSASIQSRARSMCAGPAVLFPGPWQNYQPARSLIDAVLWCVGDRNPACRSSCLKTPASPAAGRAAEDHSFLLVRSGGCARASILSGTLVAPPASIKARPVPGLMPRPID